MSQWHIENSMKIENVNFNVWQSKRSKPPSPFNSKPVKLRQHPRRPGPGSTRTPHHGVCESLQRTDRKNEGRHHPCRHHRIREPHLLFYHQTPAGSSHDKKALALTKGKRQSRPRNRWETDKSTSGTNCQRQTWGSQYRLGRSGHENSCRDRKEYGDRGGPIWVKYESQQ